MTQPRSDLQLCCDLIAGVSWAEMTELGELHWDNNKPSVWVHPILAIFLLFLTSAQGRRGGSRWLGEVLSPLHQKCVIITKKSLIPEQLWCVKLRSGHIYCWKCGSEGEALQTGRDFNPTAGLWAETTAGVNLIPFCSNRGCELLVHSKFCVQVEF